MNRMGSIFKFRFTNKMDKNTVIPCKARATETARRAEAALPLCSLVKGREPPSRVQVLYFVLNMGSVSLDEYSSDAEVKARLP